jgi:hypothetical protein
MNNQILELRSKLNQLGIKTKSSPQSIYNDSIYLEHYQNGKLLFHIEYQSKEVFENEGFAISNEDNGIIISGFDETIKYIQSIK